MSPFKRTLLLAAPVLALTAGCKSQTLDANKMQTYLQDELKAKNVTLTSVTCPTGIALKRGTTFQCTGKDDQGTTGVFDMTVTDNNGTVSWNLEGKYLDMKVLGDKLESRISAARGQPADVTCPSKNILVAKGGTFTCDVLLGGSQAKIVFTFANNDGDLEYKVLDEGSVAGGGGAPGGGGGGPVGGGAPAGYRWEVSTKTNMKFEVPNDWNKETNGDVLVITTPSRNGVGIEFAAATGGLEARADEKAMLGVVGKSLQNARMTSRPKPVQQNGLKGFVASGTGVKNGATVEWFTAALGDGRGHALLSLGFYSPSAPPAYKTEMRRVLDSIQPAG
jgi:hypothetical protein